MKKDKSKENPTNEKKVEVQEENEVELKNKQEVKNEVKTESETKQEAIKKESKTFIKKYTLPLLIGSIILIVALIIVLVMMNQKPKMDIEKVVTLLKEQEKNITEYKIYDEKSDPNKLLGTDNAYIYKVSFQDSRVKLEEGEFAFSIEVFNNEKDLELRKNLFEESKKQCNNVITEEDFGILAQDLCANYNVKQYTYKNVYVRFNSNFKDSDIKDYEEMLESILKKYQHKQSKVPNEAKYNELKKSNDEMVQKEITKEKALKELNERLDSLITEFDKLIEELNGYDDSEFKDFTEEYVESNVVLPEQLKSIPIVQEKVNAVIEKMNQIKKLCYARMAKNISKKIEDAKTKLSETELGKVEEEIAKLSDENFGSYKTVWNNQISTIKNEIAAEKERKRTYKAGSYKVGSNINAGTYIISGSGYYEVCTQADCDILSGNLLYNDNFKNRAVVILQNGQYFNFKGSGLIYKEEGYDTTLQNKITGAGYYRVGKDIEAGEYRLEGRGYYAICTKPSCVISKRELLKNDNLTNGGYVNVRNGQYLVISGSLTGSK